MLVARRYRLGDPLGRGGMGQVWRAFDEVLGREVAVKLLHPGLTSEAVAARFRLEAKTAARISNPHVVAVYDFGVDEDRLFLVMELVDGPSLAAQIRQTGAVSSQLAADYVVQAARGLDSAHTHGVVHRDVKPSNLLLAPADGGTGPHDRTVKIADFGIARVTDESAMALTASGEIAGTSQYIAPERALGEPGGPPADVYSLGCVGYHLLTGRPPFRGDGPAAIAYQHVHDAPAPPRELQPDVDDAFAALVLRMLAKDPADRPTAHEIAEWTPTAVAADVRPNAPVLATATAAAPAVVADGATRDDIDLDTNGSSSSPVHRTAARPVLAAAAGLIAVVAVSWALLDSGARTERPPSGSPTSGQSAETLPAGVPSSGSTTATPTRPSDSRPTVVAVDATPPPSAGASTRPTASSTPDSGAVPPTPTNSTAPPGPPGPTDPTKPAPTGPTPTGGPSNPTDPPGTTAPTSPATNPPTSTPTAPEPTRPEPTPKPPKPKPTKPKPTKPHSQ